MTEIKYNSNNKQIEIGCRMFTNDLENALTKINKKKVDVLNPSNRNETEQLLNDYIQKRLQFTINKKKCSLKFIGYEKEEDSIWSYFVIQQEVAPKEIEVTNSLLYDYLKEQINIIHLEIGTTKTSEKATNPDKTFKFVLN